jgi:hypothetical protein
MINQEEFRTLWPQIKVALLGLWGGLNRDELESTQGDFAAITNIIENKYGEGRESIKLKLENLMMSFDNETDKGTDPDVSSYKRSPVSNQDRNVRH